MCDTLNDYGFRTEAEAVAGHYRKHAEKTKDEMCAITHNTSFSTEEIEEYLRNWSEGELDNILCRFAFDKVPSRSEAEEQVRKNAKAFPLSHLFSTTVLDHDGRSAARIGPIESDIDGHIIRYISQTMSFVSPFLRMIVERLEITHALNADLVSAFLARSPVFDPDQRSILDAGLRAYFARDWLVGIHLLIPQIENTIRRLVRMSGGSGLKQGRNGAMPLMTLDDLLRNERVEKVFGNDVSLYLRIFLTDQRGWNVRNNVCHGLTRADQFQPIIADRLLHVLLCLGMLEIRESKHDSEMSSKPDIKIETNSNQHTESPDVLPSSEGNLN